MQRETTSATRRRGKNEEKSFGVRSAIIPSRGLNIFLCSLYGFKYKSEIPRSTAEAR